MSHEKEEGEEEKDPLEEMFEKLLKICILFGKFTQIIDYCTQKYLLTV